MSGTANESTEDFDAALTRVGAPGRAGEPERRGMGAGAALVAVGIVLVVVALQTAHTTSDPLVQNERIILAILGALVGVVGAVVWARYSITKYLRYWLLRVIYEDRMQQDRVLDVLERIASKP